MGKYVLEFDLLHPGKPVYLGVGLREIQPSGVIQEANKIRERVAVFAYQPGDSSDVLVAAWDRGMLEYASAAEKVENSSRPYAESILDIHWTAIKEISDPTLPRFSINLKEGISVYSLVESNEIIAISSPGIGFGIAICEIKNAAAGYKPSVVSQNSAGRPVVERRLNYLLPEVGARPS